MLIWIHLGSGCWENQELVISAISTVAGLPRRWLQSKIKLKPVRKAASVNTADLDFKVAHFVQILAPVCVI